MPPASRCWPTSAAGSSATTPTRSWPALLNSQPMGFYAPAQLVRDARAHGVEVRPVDVRCSAMRARWDADARRQRGEPARVAAAADARLDAPLQAVRLGFDRISGLSAEAAERIVDARAEAPFDEPRRPGAPRRARTRTSCAALAQADALQAADRPPPPGGLGGRRHRHAADADAARAPACTRRRRACPRRARPRTCWPTTARSA